MRCGWCLSMLFAVAAFAATSQLRAANVLLVTEAAPIGTEEAARKTSFESWGHTVTTIADNASQSAFDTAVAACDVVYISSTVQEWQLGTKVRDVTKGVVCEERYLDNEMRFSTADGWNASHNNIEILNNTHPVTTGLSTGFVTIFSSNQQVTLMNPTIGSGAQLLAKQNYTAGTTLAAFDKGAAMANSGTAAGRRVRLPWGVDGFNWSSLNANGLRVAQQAIAWAGETRQLVLHWKLDETSGTTAADSSGLGNAGTYTNGPTLGVSARRNLGTQFSTGSQYAFAPATSSLNAIGVNNADFTVAFWVKPGAPNGGWRPLFHKGSANMERGPGIWLQPSINRIHYTISTTASSNETNDSVASLTSGEWSHVLIRKEGSAYRCYINGQLDSTRSLAGSTSGNSGPLYVGDDPWYAGSGCAFDDVRIYNYALTIAEIADVYGFVGHWTFDEGTGTTVADSSGAGHDAAFKTGTPAWVPGVRGYALEFNGTNDAATIVPFDPPESGAVSLWLRSDGPPTARQRPWGVGGDYEMWQDPDGLMSMDLGTDGFQGGLLTAMPLYVAGKWYHIVVQYDAGDESYELYINGALHTAGVSTFDITKQLAAELTFGTRTGSTERFRGALDDFRVYSRWLGAEEIAQLYGLVGHWTFDEGTGTTVADTSGAGANASFATGTPTWIEGVRGNALKFNGANDAITDTNFDPPSTGAIAFWYRRDTQQTGQERPFGLGGDWEARQEVDGRIAFDLGGSPYAGSEVFQTTTAQPNVGRWRHLVAQFDADNDTFEVYVDGQLEGSGTNTVAMVQQAAARLSFGARTGSTQRFNGALDDFRIYNRKLSVGEIAELYGLIGWWKLDEGSGTVAYDSSGLDNHAMLVSGNWLSSAKDEGGIELDGVTDHLIVPSFGNGYIDDQFSLVAWVRADILPDVMGIITKGSGNQAFSMTFDDDSSLGLHANSGGGVTGGSGSLSHASGASLPVGPWKHVAACYDGTKCIFYIDGALDSTFTVPGVQVGSINEALYLGVHDDLYFNGRLDDLRVYNRAISAPEAAALHSGATGGGLRIMRWVEVQ